MFNDEIFVKYVFDKYSYKQTIVIRYLESYCKSINKKMH